MKLRVNYSDGVFRGGFIRDSQLSPNRCRVWRARPHPHYTECMVDTSGHGNPSTAQNWAIAQYAAKQDLSGPPDGSDSFDRNSLVVFVTPHEALRWFRGQVHSAPADLIALARDQEGPGARLWDVEDEVEEPERPLPDGQREVWDLLKGKAMGAKQIAATLGLGTTEDAVRKRVEDIRHTGRTIAHGRSLGYYRLDAPPPELPKPPREPRTPHREGTDSEEE